MYSIQVNIPRLSACPCERMDECVCMCACACIRVSTKMFFSFLFVIANSLNAALFIMRVFYCSLFVDKSA